MELNALMAITLIGMLVAILAGVHIALALGMTAMIGTYFVFEDMYLASAQVGGAAYELVRHYVFATIPLFVLMGDFVAKCGAAGDLYKVINKGLSKIPGRLAVATVTGNAAFAAVTGTSIASAAAFSRIAYPEMMKFKYKREFALGSIAGSACLGMLIPPSVLLIVWGIITEQSIGKLFVAGIIPGIILSLLYIMYTVGAVVVNPSLAPAVPEEEEEPLTSGEIVSTVGVVLLIAIVLGGIWGGAFTATEAAGIGALCAMVLAIIKGLRWKGIVEAVIDAGKTSAPIMILLVTAGMYSRFLALADIQTIIKDSLLSLGIGAFGIAVMMIVLWLLLGMILDSISIILLTVPIFATFAPLLGMDGFAFAIFGILLIEAGLLTPPFGLVVYVVKGAVPDSGVSLAEIFRGSIPYWILMLITAGLIWVFPGIASWLTTFI
jgi:C4-dicarboxylate transporter, DctM subunit